MHKSLLLGLFALPVLASAAPSLTLEQIMAHPDWIATSPEQPYFSTDSQSIYFKRKAQGSDQRLWWQASINNTALRQLDTAAQLSTETSDRVFSADMKRSAFLNQGNVWLQSDSGAHALLQSGDIEAVLGFISVSGKTQEVAVLRDKTILALSLDKPGMRVVADLRMEDEAAAPSKDFLSEESRRLFTIVQKQVRQKDMKKAELALQRGTGLVAPAPFYFGKGKDIHALSLSPDGHYLVVGLWQAERDGRADVMPNYISEDGYVKTRNVRSKVGTDKPDNETLFWLDLKTHDKRELSYDDLPGSKVDPLAALKQATAKAANTTFTPSTEVRDIAVNDSADGPSIRWNAQGNRAALMLLSYDNKDRWLVTIDAAAPALKNLHQLHDDAWVNDSEFNEFGWLADGKGLYFTSEQSGYSQLYVARNSADTKSIAALTSGQYEINRSVLSNDGRYLYFRANIKHPGNHEVYRVSVAGGKVEPVTALGGENEFVLSPDSRTLAIMHSEMNRPAELYQQRALPGAKAQVLTDTITPAFKAIDWVKPEIVAVPSTHQGQPIYARIYRDATTQKGEPKPAVMFVHGAGYLQNAHYGWSYYYHEYMFHNLLLSQGYVVIDMDYRASEGYGRNWRTAIYQQMGTPELEDYLDGVEYLVKEANVDRKRIGIYGGSYGGFMTFMALFKTPEVFAAGAALRPVADWAHYNHGYTANILNTPDVDPQAYLRSSPIEFAANLKRPLLICSGMQDDNVFFQDSVRLVQHLIELKNPHFQVAFYPIEAHSFVEPESWLDEYRRIYQLMQTEVKQVH